MRGDRGLCRAAIEYGIEPRPIRFVAAPLREVIKGSAASLGAGRHAPKKLCFGGEVPKARRSRPQGPAQIESGAILRMRKHLRMNLTAHKLLVAPFVFEWDAWKFRRDHDAAIFAMRPFAQAIASSTVERTGSDPFCAS